MAIASNTVRVRQMKRLGLGKRGRGSKDITRLIQWPITRSRAKKFFYDSSSYKKEKQ